MLIMINAPLKFFVDAQRPDGRWVLGEIACTRSEAESRAEELKIQHPDWLIEINPVGRTAQAFSELSPAAVSSDQLPTAASA